MRFSGFPLGCLGAITVLTADADVIAARPMTPSVESVAVAAEAGVQSGLEPAGYKVQWISSSIPNAMEAGRDYTPAITFRNISKDRWPDGAIFVSYHWYLSDKMLPGQYETPWTSVPLAVAPGQQVTVNEVLIHPPAEPGSYVLQVTLVGRQAWFENMGAATLVMPVTVFRPFPPCTEAAAGTAARPMITSNDALTEAGYKVEWTSVDIPTVMESGSDQKGRIGFTNISCEIWPAGVVQASYHWYSSDQVLADLAPQTRIPFAIAPGQEARLDDLLILPPAEPGSYELQVTLVDRNAWFETRGAATAVVPVTVTAGRRAAGPLISDRVSRGLTRLLWIVLAVLLMGATVASRMGRARVVQALLVGAAMASLLLAAIPVLSAPGRHLATQPFPDSADYADAARHIANGDGYVTTLHGRQPFPPPQPPGFAFVLAPFTAFGQYPGNLQAAVKWFAVAYLAAAAMAAWYLAGPLAAVLTSALLAISPFARISGTLVLSDLFAVIPLLAVLMLIRRVSGFRVFASALLAGFLVAVRMSMIVALVALALAVPTKYWRALVLGAIPGLAVLAIFQWLTFGSPVKTGYGAWLPGYAMFDTAYATAAAPRIGDGDVWNFPDRLNGQLLQWVCPCPPAGPQDALSNIWFYPLVLSGVLWVFTPPLVTLVGLGYAWRHRIEPSARFTLLLTALMVGLHTIYYYQAVRFVAGPATLLGIYGAIAVACAFERAPTTA